MRFLAPIVAIMLAGACGGDRRESPPLRVIGDDTGAGTDATPVPGPPDAGSRFGHGGDLQRRFSQPARGVVRVPESDATPPVAMLRLDAGAAAPVVHDSPVRRRRSPPVPLGGPALSATALVRDADGGTGRIRVSVLYATRCGGVDHQHADYFPPAQTEAIRIAPGVRVPVQRTRSAKVRFNASCEVLGKIFAEATNASGLESFSDPIWFTYKPHSQTKTALQPPEAFAVTFATGDWHVRQHSSGAERTSIDRHLPQRIVSRTVRGSLRFDMASVARSESR